MDKIPKLPYGQGTICWLEKRKKYSYKKTINRKRVVVYGNSVKDVMKKMQQREKESEKEIKKKQLATLSEMMYEWLEVYKKPSLKKTSYDTLAKTIRSRVEAYPIGNMRTNCITADDIQIHLSDLNENELSFSTIKKCYDALNDFYRKMCVLGQVSNNPMLGVEMLHREFVKKQTKQIEFFDTEDMKKFISEAVKIQSYTRQPEYRYGHALAANMSMGLRAGELLALTWRDIDWDKDVINVSKNLQMVQSEKKEAGKYEYQIQSIKTNQSRMVHLTEESKKYLRELYDHTDYKSNDDYVCATRDGNHATIQLLSKNIARIEENACTKVKAKGTHIIRHTCASMLFRAGISVEVIAAMLGHSVDVCRNTYLHFVEEQKIEAVKKISDASKK